MRQSRLANTDRDNFSEFFVFAQARIWNDMAPERCAFLGISDQPIDRFQGKLTPLFGSEYLFIFALSDASIVVTYSQLPLVSRP